MILPLYIPRRHCVNVTQTKYLIISTNTWFVSQLGTCVSHERNGTITATATAVYAHYPSRGVALLCPAAPATATAVYAHYPSRGVALLCPAAPATATAVYAHYLSRGVALP
jgi:hypothetical protein